MIPAKFQWQKSFYDHIIRDDADLARIREYIHNNPLKWAEDEENINAPSLPADAKIPPGAAETIRPDTAGRGRLWADM